MLARLIDDRPAFDPRSWLAQLPPIPAVAYYQGDSMNGDASNHFGPNPPAVEAMLRDVGFSRVVSFPPWTVSRDWGIHSGTAGSSLRARVGLRLRRGRSGRMVFHAYV